MPGVWLCPGVAERWRARTPGQLFRFRCAGVGQGGVECLRLAVQQLGAAAKGFPHDHATGEADAQGAAVTSDDLTRAGGAFLAGLEERPRLLPDCHHRAVPRIVSDVGATLFHSEGAEPTQLDTLAASQSGGDLVEYRRDDQFSVRLPQMRAACGGSAMSSALVNAGSVLTAARCTQHPPSWRVLVG